MVLPPVVVEVLASVRVSQTVDQHYQPSARRHAGHRSTIQRLAGRQEMPSASKAKVLTHLSALSR
jgi:hypothetical protein